MAKKAKVKYERRSFLWNIIALIIAFILGILSTLGALVGGGYFALSSVSVKDVIGFTGLNSEEYIKEEYSEYSLLKVIQELTSSQFDSLNSIGKYTPFLQTKLEEASGWLADLGVKVNVEELMSTNFADFSTYLQDSLIAKIELGGVLGLTPDSSPMMLSLCYGTEGVDYDVVDGKIVMKEGKEPTTVSTFTDTEKSQAFINGIQLGTILSLDPSSASGMVMALCYGKEGTDYDIVDNKIVMKDGKSPTTIGTLTSETGMTDLMNNLELGALLSLDPATASGLVLSICYGKEGADYDVVDGNIVMREGKTATTIGTLTSETGMTDLMNSLELGSLLSLNASDNAMMLAICYGTEGVDYDVVDNMIVMREGKTPTTIGSLIDSEESFLNDLQLGTILALDPATASGMMMSICYGTEGVDYDVVGGKVVMKEGKTATTIGTLTSGDGASDLINGLELGTLLSLDPATASGMMLSLCYGTEGVDYDVVNGKIVMKEGKTATTIGTLTSESGMEDLMNTLELGALLALDPATSSAMMLALCYGKEGVDYDVVGGKIVMKEGKTATTIGTLTGSESSQDLINNLELGTLLALDPSTSSAMMLALCYGTEGVDYDVVGGKIVMKEGKTATTIGDLSTDATGILNGMEIASLLGVDASSNQTMRYLAFGIEGANPDGDYMIIDGEIVMNEGKHKRTLADLTADDMTLIEDARICDLIAIDSNSSGLMKAIGNWQIADLKDSSKIETLKIGDIIAVDGSSSAIMQALKDKSIADLKNPATIEGLKIGDIITVDSSSSSLMQALQDKSIADLKNPATIEGLKIGDIITVDSSSSSLMQALQDKTIADLKNPTTIEGLKISDIVAVDSTSSALMQALQDKTIADLKDSSTIEGLKIGDIVAVDSTSSALMQALQDKTIADLKNPTTIEGLKIGDIVAVDSTSSALMQALQNKTIADLKNPDTIGTLTIGEIMDVDENTSLLIKALSTWTINDLKNQNRINRLKLSQVLEVGTDANGILAAISEWRIGDLTDENKFNSLTLGDLLEINESGANKSPQILITLKDTQIGEFSDRIGRMTVEDALDADSLNANKLLKHLKHCNINNLATEIENLTLDQVFEEELYTYAKTSDYNAAIPNGSPVADSLKLSSDQVVSHYVVTVNGTEKLAEFGYFIFIKGSYLYLDSEKELFYNYVHEVTPTFAYRTVNYTTGTLDALASGVSIEWATAAGQPDYYVDADGQKYAIDTTDPYSDFVTVDGVRIDLEKVVDYYTYNDGGARVADGTFVHYDEETNEYTVIECITNIYSGYYVIDELTAENTVATIYDTAVRHYYTVDTNEEVTRYTCGAWYILLGESDAGAHTSILDLASLAGPAAETMNHIPLSELYTHDVITANPDLDIIYYDTSTGQTYTNLNQLTLEQMIEYIHHLH